MRLLRARGPPVLGQVAFGSATQDREKTSSPWLENRKVRIPGSRRRPMPTPLEEKQLGKLGKEEDEEEELATKRKNK